MNKSRWRCFLLLGLLTCAVFTIVAQKLPADAPIIITQPNSTRIFATNPDNKQAFVETLHAGRQERIAIYLTNVELLDGELANAFRADAQDQTGRRHALFPEKIVALPETPWIYELTLRLPKSLENVGDVLVRVSWRGVASNRTRLASGFESKLPVDDPDSQPMPWPEKKPVPSDLANVASLPYAADRVRFMEQATFGPNAATELRIRRIGISAWLNEQMEEKRDGNNATRYSTFPYPALTLQPTNIPTTCGANCLRDNYSMYPLQRWFFREALHGDDQQLRRRVSWALGQIWVVSGRETIQPSRMLGWLQTLDRQAFGNYRDLLREMTLNPAMGNYLDMAISTRQNPNENYAREILQLFSIGLYMLNPDGTPVLDANGEPVPTYSQSEVDGFTKVLTGWSFCNQGCPNSRPGIVNFIDPMVLTEANHDQTEKLLLNYPGSVPVLPAGMSAEQDLDIALDNIFYHPNVGPFIGRMLIQQMVTSNPTPAYVGRVAAAFNNNGNGIRGDMKAVVRAILTDPEARGGQKTDPDYGHLREPVQYLTNLLRRTNVGAMPNAPATCAGMSDGVLGLLTLSLDQDVFNPPSVFNYYPFTYTLQNSTLNAPQFGIFSTGTALKRANVMNQMIFGGGVTVGANAPCGTRIDIAKWQQIAASDLTGTALVDALNREFLAGAMSPPVRTHLLDAIRAVREDDPLKRARTALYLVVTSPQFQIQR